MKDDYKRIGHTHDKGMTGRKDRKHDKRRVRAKLKADLLKEVIECCGSGRAHSCVECSCELCLKRLKMLQKEFQHEIKRFGEKTRT